MSGSHRGPDAAVDEEPRVLLGSLAAVLLGTVGAALLLGSLALGVANSSLKPEYGDAPVVDWAPLAWGGAIVGLVLIVGGVVAANFMRPAT